jgi:hypothetical protein
MSGPACREALGAAFAVRRTLFPLSGQPSQRRYTSRYNVP